MATVKTEFAPTSPIELQRYLRRIKAILIRAIPTNRNGLEGYVIMYIKG